MKKLLLLVFLILILAACKEKIRDESIELRVDINSKSHSFFDLIEKIEVISLELNERSLIGEVDEIKIIGNKIFIHDFITQCILIFSYPQGKFISKIESQGNGAGEYIRISSFDVNYNDQYVEILDSYLKRIIRYGFNGKYIKHHNIDFYGEGIIMSTSNQFFFSKYSKSDFALDYQLIVTDSNFNITNKYIEVDDFTSTLIAPGNQFSAIDNEVLFLPINSPNVYSYDENGLSIKYFINFENNWGGDLLNRKVENPKELVQILNKNDKIRGLGFVEGRNISLIDYWLFDNHFISLYNKGDGSIKNINNDIINLNQIFFTCYHDEYFATVTNPKLLFGDYSWPENILSNDAKDILKNYQETDNPCLIMVKFKEK